MRRKIPKTHHRQRGAVAIVVALALIPLVLAAGIGIDYLRSVLAREELQAAVDTAALTAAAAGASATEAQMQKTAREILNNTRGTYKLKTVTAARRDTAASTLSFGATATIDTTFMRLAGVNSMEISANAMTQIPRLGPVEVALVLDFTWSMDGTPPGDTQKKITSLKTAATSLVNKLMVSNDVSIGVVPFASWVNIGTSYNGQPWLNVPATVSKPGPKLLGCFPTGKTCTRDNNDAPCIKCEWDWTQTVYTYYKFGGTVGLRPRPYQETLDNPSAQYSGRLETVGPTVLDLTKRRAGSNPVLDKINSLNPINHEYVWNTFIPGGLIWGWNMLTSEMPMNLAMTKSAGAAVGLRKVLVLMTDGDNNVVVDDTGLNFTLVSDATPTNTMTSNICENIKRDGILIYTVGFSVSNRTTKAMLEKCATPGYYFDAKNGAALLSAFDNIHASLLRIRLLK